MLVPSFSKPSSSGGENVVSWERAATETATRAGAWGRARGTAVRGVEAGQSWSASEAQLTHLTKKLLDMGIEVGIAKVELANGLGSLFLEGSHGERYRGRWEGRERRRIRIVADRLGSGRDVGVTRTKRPTGARGVMNTRRVRVGRAAGWQELGEEELGVVED